MPPASDPALGSDKEKPAKLTDAKGGVVRLAAGQTWVELPDASYTVTVLPPAAPTKN
jgi:hypothetical protein